MTNTQIISWLLGGQPTKNLFNFLFPDRDAWTKLDDSQRSNLIQGTCIMGCQLVLADEVYDLHEVFTAIIPEYGQQYINWKQHPNNNTYMGWINKAQNEINTAKSITQETNLSVADSRLQAAKFDYVSKTQVDTIINGWQYDMMADEVVDTEAMQQSGFLFNNVGNWVKQNQMLAGAIGLTTVLSLFFLFSANSSTNQPNQPITKQNLK